MKQRDLVAMTAGEVTAMLAAARKVQLATINPDGSPHLVTMYYVLMGGQITFRTYRSSQKARNLARDPRVTCLVESGELYFDLCGVQVRGTAELIEDPAAVREIGRRVAAGMAGLPVDDSLSICGWLISASPAGSPGSVTTLSTPGGKPASPISAASRSPKKVAYPRA